MVMLFYNITHFLDKTCAPSAPTSTLLYCRHHYLLCCY